MHKCASFIMSDLGVAFLDHLRIKFLEMSVKRHKFAIICAFNCERMQSCGHLYAVYTVCQATQAYGCK